MARTSRADRLPPPVAPMLATPDRGRLPDDERFAYEFKYDGYRAVLRLAPSGAVALTSRNDKDITDEFAVVATGLRDALAGRAAVLDGELVVLNERGQPEFGLMQERRGRFQQGLSTADARIRYLVFDLLQLGDTVLTGDPYDERRGLLLDLALPETDLLAVVPAHTHADLTSAGLTPADLLHRAAASGYEGLIAKRRASRYHPGRRSPEWLKHPLVRSQEVIVCGWRPGKGRRDGGIGGLLLGAHDTTTGDLVYLGDVGTGFTEQALRDLWARLAPLERRTCPFATALTRDDARHARWVEPRVVGEVVYRQFTRGDRRLRHAAWRGLREDREPGEITAPEPTLDRPVEAPPPATQRVTVRVGERQLPLSNLDQPLYPDGTTKGEVIDYYVRVAPVLLPHLAGRPVTFVRFPDGAAGERLVDQDVARRAPDWVRTVRLPSGSRGEVVDHPLVEDLPTLVWAADLAALELRVPQWTITADGGRNPPDRLVLDLAPGPGATVVECCRVAELLREALTADGLTPLATTSGATGLRLYAGVRAGDPARTPAYARAVAERLAASAPALVTATVAENSRAGRVFVDWSRNHPTRTTTAPYSPLGRDRPTVCAPVTWDEVRACTEPEQLAFTVDDALDRVADLGDPLADLDRTRSALPR